jgi:hypothetical protein
LIWRLTTLCFILFYKLWNQTIFQQKLRSHQV